jgi:hypothetical protein
MRPPTDFPLLPRIQCATWLASFLARQDFLQPQFDVWFPTPHPDQSEVSWIVHLWKSLSDRPRVQLRLQVVVQWLINTECSALRPHDVPQVLGNLVTISLECGFDGAKGKLYDWVSLDSFPDAEFREGGLRVPFRRRVWEALLSWSPPSDVTPWLARDVRRPDCGAICFRELGARAPDTAIRAIPQLMLLPPVYWTHVLEDFFKALGAPQALARERQDAWQDCLRALHASEDQRYQLPFTTMPITSDFVDVLGRSGIVIQPDGQRLRLTAGHAGAPEIVVTLPRVDAVGSAPPRARAVNDWVRLIASQPSIACSPLDIEAPRGFWSRQTGQV